MLYLTQSNGRTIECETCEDVRNNLTMHVSTGEFVQAQSMMRAGCDQWNFVYGFSVDHVSKENIR